MGNIVYFDLETQKSAAEVGGWGHIDRMGISVVISTDQVRAIIRSVLAPDLLPALHQSSFSAAKMLRSNLTGNHPALPMFKSYELGNLFTLFLSRLVS